MAELKTQKTSASVSSFIARLKSPPLEADCHTLCSIMEQITDAPATMWGKSIVGFGTYRYTYASGRTGDWMEIGFSPRKQNLTIYLMCGIDTFDEARQKLLQQIGPHSCGSSCLYVKRLSDLKIGTLKKLLTYSVSEIRKRYAANSNTEGNASTPAATNTPNSKTASKTKTKTKTKTVNSKKTLTKKSPMNAATKKKVRKGTHSKKRTRQR